MKIDTPTLVESFAEFARSKNIDRPTTIKILEEVFRNMIKKKYGTDDGFDVIINMDKGDLEILRSREIVEDNSEDIWDFDKISFSNARKIGIDFEVGEEVAEQINIKDFGRRAITAARQTLIQKVKDIEKESLVKKYKDIIGEIVVGEVYQILSREVMMTDSEGNEIILPKREQIPKDRFRKGGSVKAVVHQVDIVNGNPRIILSRAAPMFLERLFEQEVPEVYEGLITIKKIVRQPGERAKVAVESYDDRVDPVGACVGIKGSRIHSIVRELQDENIDVINFTDNLELYVTRALNPAKVTSMEIQEKEGRISVYLKPEQVSLAIGKGGQNIKLAGKLVGFEIDVFRIGGEEEDVTLDEFSDEIDTWIIDELKRIGCDTAKNVLKLTKSDLEKMTDLEEETIDEVLRILKQEFERN